MWYNTRGFSVQDAEQAAGHAGVDWSKVPYTAEDLAKGMDVELEHGTVSPPTNVTNNDAVMTAKIALAHLNEDADYYDDLAKMEAAEQEK